MMFMQNLTADHLATMRLPLRTLAVLVRTNRRLRALVGPELRQAIERARASTGSAVRRLLLHACVVLCDRGAEGLISKRGDALVLSERQDDGEEDTPVLTIRTRDVPRIDIELATMRCAAVLDPASDVVTLIMPSGDARESSAGLAAALEAAGLFVV